MTAATGFDYLTGAGWTPAQAAGILGNVGGESGFDPNAVGDGGLAYGLAQWHPDRQATFQSVMGFPIKGSSALDQYKFLNWELNNTEKAAGNALKGATNVYDATKTVMQKFERPADGSSLGKRLDQAKSVLGGISSVKGVSDAVKKAIGLGLETNPVTAPFAMAADALGLNPFGDSCGIICQLKEWIKKTGIFQRIALAILAFIMLLAAFYLMKDNAIEKVVDKVKG